MRLSPCSQKYWILLVQKCVSLLPFTSDVQGFAEALQNEMGGGGGTHQSGEGGERAVGPGPAGPVLAGLLFGGA